MKKPVSFKIAAWLFIVGMICVIFRVFLIKHSFEKKPDFYYNNTLEIPFLIVCILIGYYFIQKGLNWVRYVSLISYLILIVSVFLNPVSLEEEIRFKTVLGALWVGSFFFRGISIYYLFSPESNRFLKDKKELRRLNKQSRLK